MEFVEKTTISESAVNLLLAFDTAVEGQRVQTLKSAWKECREEGLITSEGEIMNRGREVLKQHAAEQIEDLIKDLNHFKGRGTPPVAMARYELLRKMLGVADPIKWLPIDIQNLPQCDCFGVHGDNEIMFIKGSIYPHQFHTFFIKHYIPVSVLKAAIPK